MITFFFLIIEFFYSLCSQNMFKIWLFDTHLSSLLDPLEGLGMLKCRKLELEGRSRLPTLKEKGRARSPRIRLGRGTIMISPKFASKPTTRGLVRNWEHPWVLGQATGIWTHLTHHGLDLGEATTFPHIVYSTALRRGYIQMALFPGTPKEESWNCLGLESRDFGSSYLPTAISDWSEV
jgi:hypothetical protein